MEEIVEKIAELIKRAKNLPGSGEYMNGWRDGLAQVERLIKSQSPKLGIDGSKVES